MIKTLNLKKHITTWILVSFLGLFHSQVTPTTPPVGYEPAPNTSGNSLVVNGKFATTGGNIGGGVVATKNPATTVGGQNVKSNMWSQAYHCADSPNGTIRAEDKCPGLPTDDENYAMNKYNLMGGTWPNSTAKQLNIIPFPGDPANNVNPSNTYLYSNGNAFGEGYLAQQGSGNSAWTNPEYLIWQNTITGLQVGRYYTFYAYVKNALDGTAGASAPAVPRTRLRTGGTDGLPNGTEHDYIQLANLTAGDKASALKGWKRISITFQATQTSEKFKVTSAAQGIDGDDFQMTAVEVVPYVPALTASATNTNLCVGNTLNLQATSPITTGVSYAWTGPNGFTSAQQNPTRVNLMAADFGTYTVTLTDQYGITNIKTIDITQATTGCATIEARNDGYNTPTVTNTNGGVVGVVTVNDIINQQLITSPTTQVNITLTNNGGMNGATLGADGKLTIPAGTPAGVYILTYRICNKTIPTDCSTATITVEVYLDSDGDGYPDVVDLDDDNDGILDTDEASACSAFTPFFVENFGTGARTSTPYTNYTYMATPWDYTANTGGQLNDGFYAVVNNIDDTASWSRCAWQSTLKDHTPGDTNGRMAFFNATYNPSEEFYNRSGITVPANTPVRLSFWAINVDAINNTCGEGNFNRVLPNVRVLIKTNDGLTEIKAFSTGNIARDEQWHQYSFDFNPGNNTQIRFILMNDSEGGNGNDIAIDDIQIVKVCDTDGDGIPNDLDLDSDGDGCSDAIEGDEKLRSDHLLANGAINVAANGGVGNLPSNLGVPNIVNSGTLDIGNDVGQGGGTAYDNTINPCLMDAIDDDFSANCVSSITGGIAGDVSENDLMYGLPVNDAWMTFTVMNDGGMTGVSIDANGNLTVPAGTPEGTYTITYQICKNNCDTAKVIVKVCRIYAVNDINQTPQGVSVNGNVITNDDSTNGTLTVQSATYYNSAGVLTNLPLGTATIIYIPGGTTAAGTMTLNADGTYKFVPTATFVGEVPLNYVATNGSGLSDAAILTIQVIPSANPSTNDKPIAQDDTSFTEAGIAVTNNALANDSDPDGNPLSITAAKQGANTITIGSSFTVAGTNAAGVAVPNAGTITINATGGYTYTPAAGFVGDVNPINYTISDGNGGTDTANIYITVKPNITNTTFANDDANTAPKGTAMNGSVLTNDTDPEGNNPTVTGGVFFGGTNTTGITLTLGTASQIAGVGSVTLNSDGTYKYTPDPNFVGTAEVVYTKCDDGVPQACDKATLYLTTLDVFDLQVCTDPNVIYSVGTSGIVPVNVSTGTTGAVFPNTTSVSPNALGYSVTSKKFYYFETSNNPISFVSYDPLTNVKTSLAIPYSFPHAGGTVPRGVVTADGTGYYLLNEGVELYYYNIAANTWTLITNNLVDQNGNPATVIKTKEISGDIAIDGSNNLWILSSAYGAQANPADATHSLYKISGPLPTTAVASLSVALLQQSAVNPNNETFTGIAFNATGQIYLGTPNRIYRLNNDFTITQLANVSGASDLASCSLPITAFPQDISGNVFNDANGLGGTPANTIDGVGTNLGGTLNAVLIDRNNGKVVATVPVAANGTYSFPQTAAGIYTIEITTATATVGANPPAVTLPSGWSNLGEKLGTGAGTDGTPDGKLNVDVNGAPVTNANFGVFKDIIDAVDDVNQTPQGIAVSGDILINDDSTNGTKTLESAQYYNAAGVLTTLPIGTAATIYIPGGTTAAGSMLLRPDGTYTFTPTATFVGSVPVTYTINNGAGVKDKATLEIQVIPPANLIQNDNPVAINDVSRTEMNMPVSGNALANDSDPDGNSLTISGATFGGSPVTIGTAFTVSGVDASGAPVANAGSVVLNANGTYTYTPATGFVGTVNPITYTASDSNGGTDTAFIYLTVNPELGNTTYANDDANSAPKGTTMTGNVSTNDTDPENNQTTVTGATTKLSNGTVVTIPIGAPTATTIANVGTIKIEANGDYTFVPLPNYVGTTQIVYTKCDNGSPQACDTATLYLTTIDTVAGYCYKFPNTNTGVTIPTKHGITALSRAGEASGNWPMLRQSTWTTLEAKTKGFVVNRVAFDGSGNPVGIAAANFVEGMMVYDTTNNCLKLYNGTIWSCYSTPACP